MSRRPNRDAAAAREILERYGHSARNHLYKRIGAGHSFGLFLVDGRLSFAAYPSARCSGLAIDCPNSVVGIYVDTPTLAEVLGDLHETEQRAAAHAAASA